MDYYLPEAILDELNRPEILNRLIDQYKNAQPFPHIALDGLFDPGMLKTILEYYPSPSDTQWWKYDNILERKLAKNDLRDVHPYIRYLVYELMEKRFVNFLEALTGIEGLIVDHTLNGGGLHQIIRGGKLDIHADYNYHPITGLDRRLNVLLYLNENWESSWGGNLELWDKDMTFCVRSLAPLFNRVVIFSTTDNAFHGHPDPLNCPGSQSRKSIALYYYTNGRPEGERTPPHSTLFKRRPQDPISKDDDDLRARRAQRRLT